MKQLLCKPCAMYLRSRGKTVEPVPGRNEKITCDECDLRRFGRPYEVTGRAKKSTKEV